MPKLSAEGVVLFKILHTVSLLIDFNPFVFA